ncbi:MAG: hypothetical protein C4523_15125 [Myxococcales bacterium]|nr:MAG: hypothetical protein C4523_15125 [Myxococcales bacterium]
MAAEGKTTMRTAFDPKDMPTFESTGKVALLATVNPRGLPHVTLIASMQAKTPTQLVWGKFSEGLSKQHVLDNPRTGFLFLTLDKRLWRGTARYTHLAREGEDYAMFNMKPMFRYNTYFGINTVYYMDLLTVDGPARLPMHRIVPAALLTRLAKGAARTSMEARVLKPFAENLFNRMDALKFIATVRPDGFPWIAPLIQCQAADSRRLTFSPLAYGDELAAIPSGAPAAVYALTMGMESVLTRGIFRGFITRRGVRLGTLDLDYVYNSMPPNHGQIYPATPLTPITRF